MVSGKAPLVFAFAPGPVMEHHSWRRGAAYEREIFYRVLTGPLPMMRDAATPDTMLRRVHQVIRWLRANYMQPVTIEALASRAAMSVSAFHRHFKTVSSLSPLQ